MLRQTHAELEVLVIDDASTDGTEALVKRLRDARISYLRHENNRGGSAARNTGMAAARGELIAFQDSDDTWLPHKLERQIAELQARGPATGAVYCPYWREYPDGRRETHPTDTATAPRGKIQKELLRGNFIGTPTILARRACCEQVGGFDEQLPRFQDWEWMIRVSGASLVGFVEEPLVRAGFSGHNVTDGHSPALVAAERHILDKHWSVLEAAGEDLLAYRLWHLAHVTIMQGDAVAGRDLLRRALELRFRPGWAAMRLLALAPPLYRAAYRSVRGGTPG